MRLIILSVFAAIGPHGFKRTLLELLPLAVVFCALMAALRREALFAPVFTHWDEAAAYAVIGRLVAMLA